MMAKTALAAFPLLALALAGCSDGGGTAPAAETTAPLPPDKGAIAGLLIDDAFRPLHLTDDPAGDYEAKGILLLQPVGLTAKSGPDGVFAFSGLEPGSYTLRADVEGHEAAPLVLDVRAGEYTEVDLVARRVANAGSRIVTSEFSLFIPCAADYVVNGNVLDCTLDQSGDSFRAGFYSNYTSYPDVTYLVTEMKANNADRYEVQVRCETPDEYLYYGVSQFEGDYTKIVMPLGGISAQSAELSYGPNLAWNNDCELNTILFTDSQFREEVQGAGVPVCCGAGVHFGVKAKFVQSLFLGPPEVDISTYGVLA